MTKIILRPTEEELVQAIGEANPEKAIRISNIKLHTNVIEFNVVGTEEELTEEEMTNIKNAVGALIGKVI